LSGDLDVANVARSAIAIGFEILEDKYAQATEKQYRIEPCIGLYALPLYECRTSIGANDPSVRGDANLSQTPDCSSSAESFTNKEERAEG